MKANKNINSIAGLTIRLSLPVDLTMAQYTAAIQEVEGLISELQKSYQILNSGISQNAQTISNMFAGIIFLILF